MWHRGLAEQLSLLCDSFVSDRLLDVRNFMIDKNKIAEFIFLAVFSSPLAVITALLSKERQTLPLFLFTCCSLHRKPGEQKLW